MSDIKDLEWLEIFLGYACNVRCNFCYQKDLRLEHPKNFSKTHVESLIDQGFKAGKRFIIFSWWEATLDKNLPDYILYAKNLGFEHIRVHTNGFRFQKYDYLLDLANKGLTWVTISVHWIKKIHDLVSKVPWSFDVILKALVNFQKYKLIDSNFTIDTNSVVCKQNYKNIPQLVKFLSKFDVTRGQIVLAYSLDLFTQSEKQGIIPEYKYILPYLEETLDIAHTNKKKFVLENIPFCLLGDQYYSDVLENIKVLKESYTILDTQESNLDNKWMYKWEKCKGCKLYENCRGIPEDYYNTYGDDFLQAIR